MYYRSKNKWIQTRGQFNGNNCRTLSTEGIIVTLKEEPKNLKWYVIGLGEVSRIGGGDINLKSYTLYLNGAPDERGGIGFLISKVHNMIHG